MRRSLFAVFAVALLAAACSSSAEDAQTAYCEDLDALFEATLNAQELTG
jgi:nitrous oxide reductase accessory protein NosL